MRGLILDRHFHSHFDSHRTGVRKEDGIEPWGCYLDESFGQPDPGFVCEPAEHDVGHGDKLVFDDSIQNRMIVAMDGAPPGRHAVDEFCSVGEAQPNALGGNNRKNSGFPRHRRVGMPDLRAVCSQQFLPMRIRHVPHATF